MERTEERIRETATPEEQNWLQPYRWGEVLRMLAAFRQLKPEAMTTATAELARGVWERGAESKLSLVEALGVCRECHGLHPFGENDCEIFVVVARNVVKPYLWRMSATLAATVVTVVGDYVRGTAEETEMRRMAALILSRTREEGQSGSSGIW